MSDTLKYKGYEGSVEYSEEDNILHGRVLFIRDLISYEGSSLEELKSDFRGAIDDYLTGCEDMGIDPDKPVKNQKVAV